MVITQTFKGYGIRTNLMEYLKRQFKSDFPGLIMESSPVTSSELINRIVNNSRISEITFTENNMPSDIADEIYPTKQPKQKTGSMKVVLQAGYQQSFPLQNKVKRLLGAELTPNQFLSLDFVDADTVSVKLQVNGRNRTITCGDSIDLQPVFDITDEINVWSGGNPKYEEIDKIALELLTDILKEQNEGKIKK